MNYVFLVGIIAGVLYAFLSLGKNKNTNGLNFNFSSYSELIGLMESDNNYMAKNQSGALGKYQIIPATLNFLQNEYDLEKWLNENNFLTSPSLQDIYFEYLVNDTLKRTIDLHQYLGAYVCGSLRFQDICSNVNIYGILAGAHLGGIGGVKNFLKGIKDPNDGHTSVSDYVAYFSKNLS